MMGFSKKYDPDTIASFRQGDQSLPGKTFPLLPVSDDQLIGRYGLVMDGQWRVRDITSFLKNRNEKQIAAPEFGVCPLPYPEQGRKNAGWVNGNFFIVPRGAKNPEGAWEFVQFWIGLKHPQQAAETCRDGGWIPVSKKVTDHPVFQKYLNDNPLFQSFVNLAESPNQFPVPVVAGANFYKRSVDRAAFEAMTQPDQSLTDLLTKLQKRVQNHFDRLEASHGK